jgi:AcrR family transcriptional regulator
VTRKRLTRDESRAQTVQRLLETADRVFLERGFVAASVEEIAEQAGYSRGAVYANFPNKSALFRAVSIQHLQADALELFEAVREVATVDELPAALQSWFQRQITRDSRRALMEAEYWMVSAREDEARESGTRVLDASRLAVEELIREQADRFGVTLPADPATLAAAMVALRQGFAMHAWFGHDELDAAAFARSVAVLIGIPTAPPGPPAAPASRPKRRPAKRAARTR